MHLVVDVSCEGESRPPVGSPVAIEVRDTALADAPSTLLERVVTQVRALSGDHVATGVLNLASVTRGATVRVHVDVNGDGRVSVGDFVSFASYPVPPGATARLHVLIKQVR